jgi:Fe-S-cluster containining protein
VKIDLEETFLQRLFELYAAVGAEMAKLSFQCQREGNCCAETLLGPKPYPLEIKVIERYIKKNDIELAARTGPEDPCPFLTVNACRIYPARPLECRMFTCDGSSLELYQIWKQRLADLCREYAEHSGTTFQRISLRQAYASWEKD